MRARMGVHTRVEGEGGVGWENVRVKLQVRAAPGACPPAEIFASEDLRQANESSGRIYMRRRSWPYLNGRALGAQTSRIERGGIVLTRLCRATSQRCAPPRAPAVHVSRTRGARVPPARRARAPPPALCAHLPVLYLRTIVVQLYW